MPATVQPVREDSREMFEALTSGQYSSFAIMSVLYDGEPTECIVNVLPQEDGTVEIMPLAIVPTDSMLDKLTDDEGNTPEA